MITILESAPIATDLFARARELDAMLTLPSDRESLINSNAVASVAMAAGDAKWGTRDLHARPAYIASIDSFTAPRPRSVLVPRFSPS